MQIFENSMHAINYRLKKIRELKLKKNGLEKEIENHALVIEMLREK